MISTTGKWNIGIGLWMMAAFMTYGFYLIYARDFAPDREAWIAASNVSPHFEARLAHVHGNLFAFLNIAFGYLLLRLPIRGVQAKWISGLALTGMLACSQIVLGLIQTVTAIICYRQAGPYAVFIISALSGLLLAYTSAWILAKQPKPERCRVKPILISYTVTSNYFE